MAEAAIAISYPEPWNRGKALGYWLTYRLGGQIVGGAINLGLNADRNEAGKVSYTVFLIFIAIQAAGPLVGLFLTPPEKVERKDGKKVDLKISGSIWGELVATTKLLVSKKFLLVVLFIGQAVFAEAVFFTYLSRKLPSCIMITCSANTPRSMVFGQGSSSRIIPVRYRGCHGWKSPWGMSPSSHAQHCILSN
jgi:MFS family permease